MSKSKNFIYSTLTADQRYQNYGAGGGDMPVALADGVFIRGGSNTVDKYDRQTTPGVVTTVSDEELTYLQANTVFRAHVDNGYIIVSDKNVEAETVAADMNTRSDDAPLQPEDFKEGDPQPVVGDDEPAASAPQPRGGRRA